MNHDTTHPHTSKKHNPLTRAAHQAACPTCRHNARIHAAYTANPQQVTRRA